MTFLDRKTQVLDIELTQYGKSLLSRGAWKPEYYIFLDDDILYDSEYGGEIEIQNSASVRIQETPRLRTQASFTGAETEIKKLNEFIRMGEQTEQGKFKALVRGKIQQTPDRHYALSAPLGTSSPDSEKAPAWSINVLMGEISGTVQNKTGEQPTQKIPQLNIKDVEFKVEVKQGDVPQTEEESLIFEGEGGFLDPGFMNHKFSDGTFIKITKDGIVIEVEEINTIFENENFDIEVYEITTDIAAQGGDEREVLIPLFFQRRKPRIVNNILLDDEDQNFELPELDPSYIEYFMEILVDNEIDTDLLCRLGAVDRPDGLYGQRFLDCEDRRKVKPLPSLYQTSVTEEELEEKC